MRSEDGIRVKQAWTRKEVRSTTEAGVACTWPRGLEQQKLDNVGTGKPGCGKGQIT